MKPYEQLIQHWRSEGLIVIPGASEGALRAFETKHNVVLPSDFREYLSHVDGMAQVGGHDDDEKGFAFWPLSRIKTIPEECAASKVQITNFEGVERYFAFADYMQWSWAYAICLAPNQEGRVLQFGTNSPKIVADSFAQFVEAYVRDSEHLYLPQTAEAAGSKTPAR